LAVGAEELKGYPKREVSVMPWQAELTTLLAVWRRLFPFGLVTPLSAKYGVSSVAVPLEMIKRFEVTFPAFPTEEQLRVHHFMLVFLATTAPGAGEWLHSQVAFKAMLQDDEEGDRTAEAVAMRKSGVHVLTVWEFDAKTRKATFWLKEDVVARMKEPLERPH
jgi:hypothetical protein